MSLNAETRAKALAARKAAVANNPYRTDWADADLWASLAAEQGIRLPFWHVAPTPKLLQKWHRRLSSEQFREVYGCSPIRLIELNPRMPLRAFIGQMLESSKSPTSKGIR